MALTFPLSAASFADIMRVRQADFWLDVGQEYSGQGNGVIRGKDLRPALWKANITTRPMSISEAMDYQAMVESLDGSINTFYCYNPLRPNAKVGSFVDTSCQINSLGGDGKSLSLKGLPASQALNRGDLFHFDYTSGVTCRALHRVVESITANGSGVTGTFEVRPAIRTGAAVNNNVRFNKAAALMCLVPGTFQPANADLQTVQFSFSAQQVPF